MSVPAVIGRYRLGPRLGSGGFAVVWLAHDESLDVPIAIKVMADNWADRMDLRERFLAEARMLRRAASHRVVQVFDIGELPDGRPYFVMEYADRGTLADRAAGAGGGALPLPEALRLTAEVARGVVELHAAGIVHRDLKPSNVLIRSTPDGGERLLIADLGVAKNLAQASGLTMSVGSAGYMAPEQAEPNSGVDVRADVYSLGALAYHLLSGLEPGPPGQVLAGAPNLALPPPVRRLLEQTLEPRVERRWPDPGTLAAELDRLAQEYRVPVPRSPWRWVLRGLAVVVLVAVLAGAGATAVDLRRPVRVRDASGHLSVAVPRSWGRYLVPGGWDPGVLGLQGGPAPGLLVADRKGGWPRLDQGVDGVFVGRTTDPGLTAAVAKIVHPDCTGPVSKTYDDPPWTGQVRRWDHCEGPAGRTLEEISLTRAGSDPARLYVQIRQDGGADATERVLDDLQVSASS